MLGGQCQFTIDNVTAVRALIADKKLRPLAVTSTARQKDYPDLPTMMEAGVPDYVVTSFFGVVAPAGTPAADRRAAQRRDQRQPEVGRRAGQHGEARRRRPRSKRRKHFGAFIAAETRKWTEIAKVGGHQRGLMLHADTMHRLSGVRHPRRPTRARIDRNAVRPRELPQGLRSPLIRQRPRPRRRARRCADRAESARACCDRAPPGGSRRNVLSGTPRARAALSMRTGALRRAEIEQRESLAELVIERRGPAPARHAARVRPADRAACRCPRCRAERRVPSGQTIGEPS